jgi:hypothetical protein
MNLLVLQLFEIVLSSESSDLQHPLELWESLENVLQVPILQTVESVWLVVLLVLLDLW